jgi:GNAT superfamily N-acetyltransferase
LNVTHFQTYTSDEAEKIIELWNRSFGGEFPLDLRLWRQNVDMCKRSYPDATLVAVREGHIIGAVVGKNPNRISAIFVAPEFRRRGIATELLARVEVAFTGELEAKLIAGQDDRHFFPGVPIDGSAARSFFTARGFTEHEGLANDLVRDISTWHQPPTPLTVAKTLQAQKITIRRCTEWLVPFLLEHIQANYSDRWLRDTRDRLNAEPNPSEIIVAVQDETNVVGFCHTYSTKSVIIGPSIYWRNLIGEHYGGLGPIGVAKTHRKIGLGLELLNRSITYVAESGAERMVIDWTNLVEFYAKAGFQVWKSYSFFTKSY